MKSSFLWVLALSSVLCLAACGGGGKGKSPVDIAESSMNAVDEKADVLFVTGRVFTARSGVRPGERLDYTCEGDTCAIERASLSDDTKILMGPVINGVQLREFRSRFEEHGDSATYGTWLTDSLFYVQRSSENDERGDPMSTEDDLIEESIIGLSYGDASRTNPASALSGTATWRGAMVALDATDVTMSITGRTELTYDFGRNTLDVLMDEIRVSSAQGSGAYGDDLTWEDLAVTDGQFSQGSGADSIRGTFYGDAHEEVGGIFERSNLVGAFGATRQ